MERAPQTLREKKVCSKVLLAGISGVAACFGYGLWKASHIHIEHKYFVFKKLKKEYKVAFISDLHAGEYNQYAILDLVESLSEMELDAIILGGDVVDANTPNYLAWQTFGSLGNLPTKYGTYMVWGDSDRKLCSEYASGGDKMVENILDESKIKILSECYLPLGDDLRLYGREDIVDEVRRRRSSLTSFDRADDAVNVLVDHVPMQNKLAASLGFDMMLCGNINSIRSPQDKTMLKLLNSPLTGWSVVDSMYLLNSPGAGVCRKSVRVRFRERCTCHVITMQPYEEVKV